MHTTPMRFIRNAALGSVATLLIAAAVLPAPAFADLCQNPAVTIFNDKDFDMDVRKLEYFDECDLQWRTEDVQNRIIPPGGSTTYTDNLDYVGNCVIVAFRLYRRVRGSNDAWGSIQWGNDLFPEEGSNVVCNSGVTYTLHNH